MIFNELEVVEDYQAYAIVKADDYKKSLNDLEDNEEMYILKDNEGEELASVTVWNDGTITVFDKMTVVEEWSVEDLETGFDHLRSVIDYYKEYDETDDTSDYLYSSNEIAPDNY